MNIKSAGNQVSGLNTYKQAGRLSSKSEAGKAVIADGFKQGGKSEKLDADKMKTLATGKGKKAWGKKDARALIGMGVMFGGMMAAAAMASPFSPALMIGAFFGGMAIMAS